FIREIRDLVSSHRISFGGPNFKAGMTATNTHFRQTRIPACKLPRAHEREGRTGRGPPESNGFRDRRRTMLNNPPTKRQQDEDHRTPADDRLLDDCGLGTRRLRAHRWERSDLPWLSSVKLPWGLEVRLLNISSSGVLVESGSKLAAGSVLAFHLSGPNKNLV